MRASSTQPMVRHQPELPQGCLAVPQGLAQSCTSAWLVSRRFRATHHCFGCAVVRSRPPVLDIYPPTRRPFLKALPTCDWKRQPHLRSASEAKTRGDQSPNRTFWCLFRCLWWCWCCRCLCCCWCCLLHLHLAKRVMTIDPSVALTFLSIDPYFLVFFQLYLP